MPLSHVFSLQYWEFRTPCQTIGKGSNAVTTDQAQDVRFRGIKSPLKEKITTSSPAHNSLSGRCLKQPEPPGVLHAHPAQQEPSSVPLSATQPRTAKAATSRLQGSSQPQPAHPLSPTAPPQTGIDRVWKATQNSWQRETKILK